MSPQEQSRMLVEHKKKRFADARYSEDWNPAPADMVRIRIVTSLVGSQKKVLDAGCYDGTLGSYLGNANEVYGIDLSSKGIQLARRREADAIVSDVDVGLPFVDESFDVVLAGEIIEHVFDADFLVDEIKRVLKPDGFIVITTPNLVSLGRRFLMLLGKNPIIETRWTPNSAGHVRYFVKKTLFDLLRSHALSIDLFRSDIVNFDNTGRHFSAKLARLVPSIGKTLIVKASPEVSTNPRP